MLDTIIIGSGPSGVSAAVYLKRANKNVLVITTNNSSLLKASEIENYYGFRSISGKELYDLGIKQLKELEIPVHEEEAVNIDWENKFVVETNKSKYEAPSVIIATGISRNTLRISNLEKYEGRGISYCATCDGFFYKKKKVGIVGNGNLALHEINYLKNITSEILVFTNGEEPSKELKELGLTIITEKISSVDGSDHLEKVVLANNESIAVDGLFIAIGVANGTSFAKKLGLKTMDNYLVADDNYQTNIEGLYAIGDVLGKNMQVNKAVNDGYIASKGIISFLKKGK